MADKIVALSAQTAPDWRQTWEAIDERVSKALSIADLMMSIPKHPHADAAWAIEGFLREASELHNTLSMQLTALQGGNAG